MHGYFESPEELQAAILYERGDYIELDELTDYLDDNDLVYIEREDFDETYDDMLDDSGQITIGGYDYYPSEVFKAVDVVAYRRGRDGYLDALSDDQLVLDF